MYDGKNISISKHGIWALLAVSGRSCIDDDWSFHITDSLLLFCFWPFGINGNGEGEGEGLIGSIIVVYDGWYFYHTTSMILSTAYRSTRRILPNELQFEIREMIAIIVPLAPLIGPANFLIFRRYDMIWITSTIIIRAITAARHSLPYLPRSRQMPNHHHHRRWFSNLMTMTRRRLLECSSVL